MTVSNKTALTIIGVVSVVVPALVALLILLPESEGAAADQSSLSILPMVNAIINSLVAGSLVMAYVFIRQGKVELHKKTMLLALGLSVLFLVSYITYHSGPGHVKYGGTGTIKVVYLSILASHILLSVAIVPMALISVFRGLSSQFDKHRKIARWTLPIWLYVAITGVVVYLMAHPFNPG